MFENIATLKFKILKYFIGDRDKSINYKKNSLKNDRLKCIFLCVIILIFRCKDRNGPIIAGAAYHRILLRNPDNLWKVADGHLLIPTLMKCFERGTNNYIVGRSNPSFLEV